MYSNGKRLYHPRSIVTDHYLLDSITASVPYGLTKWEEGPANNCHFRMILKIILKKKE